MQNSGDPQEQSAGLQTANLDLFPMPKVQVIFATFVKTASEDLQNLEAALAQGNLDQAANLAHRLCGGAYAIGAQGLADLSKSAELKFAEGQQADLNLLKESLANTLQAIEAYAASRSSDL